MARTWLTGAATRVPRAGGVGRRLGSASTTRSASPRTVERGRQLVGRSRAQLPGHTPARRQNTTRRREQRSFLSATEPKHLRLSTGETRLSTSGFLCGLASMTMRGLSLRSAQRISLASADKALRALGPARPATCPAAAPRLRRAAGKEGREPDRNVLMYLRTGSAGPTDTASGLGRVGAGELCSPKPVAGGAEPCQGSAVYRRPSSLGAPAGT